MSVKLIFDFPETSKTSILRNIKNIPNWTRIIIFNRVQLAGYLCFTSSVDWWILKKIFVY